MNDDYVRTVQLLLTAAPEVFANEVFAMKGGTALNLFVQDMPRLSVDIDVVFVPHTTPRDQALKAIGDELAAVKGRLEKLGLAADLLRTRDGDEAKMHDVEARSAGLGERLGLRVITKHTTPQQVSSDFLPYRFRVTGVDRPGIVQRVTAVLAGRGVNVASLDSRLEFAAESGTPMFILEAALQIPSALALADLRRELATACEEENWDFSLEGC